MFSKQKNTSLAFYLFVCLVSSLFACSGTTSEEATQTSNQEANSTETAPPNGIFRQQKNFTVEGIHFVRHQVNIRNGQNEETIIYTVFEDKAQFQPLNELIADYANLARIDSIKINDINNIENEEGQYETTQRMDTVYIINSDIISVSFSYYLMANGMECENKENRLFAYSAKSKKVMTLKDVFGAKLGIAQEKIKAQLRPQFLKSLDDYSENAFERTANNEADSLKMEIADNKLFFQNISFMLMADSIIFSYPVGKSCSLPSYLSAKMALKDCE
jgi:hypothetical protein